MACPEGKTQDGFELHFGTNHLGHFLLFHLLKDALLASASPSFNSRAISVSSSAHRAGSINFDDLMFEKAEYDPMAAYAQSKLANIHFANEIDRRYQDRNLRAMSLHPGSILKDDPAFVAMSKTPAQGAATAV
ncbi:hypothetical protein Hte_004725 [Hypoxylon texense]